LVSTLGALAHSQEKSADWQKTYPISAKPSLTLSTGDASVEVFSCSACRELRVHVEWRDGKPSDFTVTESQSGDHVSFELKEKMHIMGHALGKHWQSPRVTVETPSALDLQGQTADGALKVSGVQGNLELHTSDGAVEVEDVRGALRLTTSDGSIRIHNLVGTLDSRSSDGHAVIDGKFTALQVHTSDGKLQLTLDEGTQLNNSSRIESSDGPVTVLLPRKLAVDLELNSSDGRVSCTLPITMDGYQSHGDSQHSLRGHLNGGGTPLVIHTRDGNLSVGAL
jgi:hypothetical protein